MNYETNIKEGHHLEILHKPNKIAKEERTSAQRDLGHLIDGNSFYPICPPSIKEILKHETMTDKNSLQLIIFAYGNSISPTSL